MKSEFLKYSIVFSVVLFCFWSCMPEQGDRKAMIRTEVERRLSEFRKNKMKTCREELIKTATLEVDSLLIERARLNKNDLEKPEIPEKPSAPEIMSPLDSSPVQPILEAKQNE